MGLFDQFPYTNFHELNLDWILMALKELEHTIEQFVAINALKYADPIQWNIVSQYEKNTIVIDPQSGTAYISVQPVPSGVALTNEDYWTVVFDLGQFVVRASKNFANTYEAETTLTATVSTAAGGWIIWGDTLYKALVNITAGDSYVIGGNIAHFTMEDVIGHLEDLNTTDKTNVVAAINEVAAEVVNKIGDLADLSTTDKSNLVNAINEVLQTFQTTVGDLNDLNTTVKDNVVNSINELVARFNAATFVNVKEAGAKGDGTTDDTSIIQDLLNSGKNLYFPAGEYYISQPLQMNYNQLILGSNRASTIVQHNSNAASAIICCSSRASIMEMSLSYADTINVAASNPKEFIGICSKADITPWPLQRTGLYNISISHVGTAISDWRYDEPSASGMFSVGFHDIEITDFSYAGIYIGAGSTGDIFDNVYINNGVNDQGTASAKLKSAVFGIYLQGSIGEIFNQVNIEWLQADDPLFIKNSNVIGSHIHLEEVATKGIYNGYIHMENSNLVVDEVSVFYSWMYLEGTSIFYGIGGTNINNLSAIDIGLLNIVGLNTPDWGAFPNENRGMTYAGANCVYFFYNSANPGKYVVNIDNYIYYNHFPADTNYYEDPPKDGSIEYIKFGVLPEAGVLSNRPTVRLCPDHTRYYATNTYYEYLYTAKDGWIIISRGHDYSLINGTADSNFSAQTFTLYKDIASSFAELRIQGTITNMVGNIGDLGDSTLDADIPVSINNQIWGLHINAGVVSIGNDIGYAAENIPSNVWFKLIIQIPVI